MTNLLWNVFDRYLNRRGYACDQNLYGSSQYNEDRVKHFVVILLENFAGEDLDQVKIENSYHQIKRSKKIFYDFIWYKKYDFIEYFLSNGSFNYNEKDQFIKLMNNRLEAENSAYRVIDDIIVPIIDKVDIHAINEGLSIPHTYEKTKAQLSKALEHLSDKQTPDYLSSIKNSISAIETLFRHIFSKNGDLYAQTLSKILTYKERMPFLHQSLIKSIDNLFAFTSDQSGIRHGEKPIQPDKSHAKVIIEKADAIFMVVFCSSLASFIVQKYESNSD